MFDTQGKASHFSLLTLRYQIFGDIRAFNLKLCFPVNITCFEYFPDL